MPDVDLISRLAKAPHTVLQPPPTFPLNAVALAKQILDPLAKDVAEAQLKRREDNRKKRKRGEYESEEQVLQIRRVYTQGLAVRQVWEQARRILDSAFAEVERALPEQPQLEAADINGEVEYGEDDDSQDVAQSSDADSADLQAFEDEDEDMSASDGEDYDEEEDVFPDDLGEEDIENLDEDEMPEDLSDAEMANDEIWKQDPNGLNDGFFSIDDFNRQSQFLEDMDARGEDDNPSDEDDVDWDANPLSQPMPKPSSRDVENEDPSSGKDEDDEDDGPTFGDADLDAPTTDDEADDGEEPDLDDGMPGMGNTNEIRYVDFFEPPPKKLSKTKRMRALPKTQPQKTEITRPDDGELSEDIQRAMNDVNRDIFASESEEELSASDASDSRSRNMSTHEKQRAKIASEIRRLEAANVSKRDWTLSGEARAADRPLNSLIEEDLDFERAGKPVPVVTAETSEEIEQLIKRRIIAREFDEVLRRHPDAIGGAADQRRGRVEVDDSKPQSGLAEIYEQEHLKENDPNHVDQRSKATKKQHAEIEKLWKEVTHQLDLLSNLHFKPRRIESEIKVVEDKPRIAMEDARPAGEGVEEQSQLAPQEVYRAGQQRTAGELTSKSGASRSKEEMSREEKKRQRRREKERTKKGKLNQGTEPARPNKEGKQKKTKGEEKQNILDELKRGGVKVVDKKGELQSLSKKAPSREETSSSALKL